MLITALAAPPSLPAPASPAVRQDGWTPARQRDFLRAIAEGDSVAVACAGVGMSTASAYALRNRAAGAGFALGWSAARLIARERVADQLLARAMEGQVERVTRADGASVERLRFDNRLALGLLARLDRQARDDTAEGHAARMVAHEFDAYTDALGRDDSPARAGLFLGSRAIAERAEMAPVIALARADRFVRTGAARAEEVDAADLDFAARDGWTADQWRRAEAAGLLAILPPEPPAPACDFDDEEDEEDELERDAAESPLPQLRRRRLGLRPVWEDETHGTVTDLPPRDGFDGHSEGQWGEAGYFRTLDFMEQIAWAHLHHSMPEDFDEGLALDRAERDRLLSLPEV